MRRFSINPKYNSFFVNNQLTKLFINSIKGELNKLVNVPALNYIEKNYKISKDQFIKILSDNIRVSKYSNNMIVISFNNLPLNISNDRENIIENEHDNIHVNKTCRVYLHTLIDFINDGNLQIKGSNMFNNIIKYLQNNVGTLYKIAWIRRSSELWQ